MEDRLLTPTEVGHLLGLAPRSLERWRAEGRGPKAVRLNNTGPVRYRLSTVLEYLDGLSEAA